ncbi:POK18 protein, partial [Eurystomus gularis]|nr:POK18 protein [Eurystomus gularis]
AQKLLGNSNWVRSYLGLTTEQLSPLFALLRGDPDLTSPRTMTKEVRAAMEQVEWAITNKQVHGVDTDTPVCFFVVIPEMYPTVIIGQWNEHWQDLLHVL